jgi:hypothetical protein
MTSPEAVSPPAVGLPAEGPGGPLPSPAVSDFPRELRFIFVQLLFSLTAAETARQFSELVLQGRAWDGVPAYAHLLLASMVVVTSWVGWTMSEASRRLSVDKVFSWAFLVLLVDVGLVFLYFLLVRGAEIPTPGKPVEPSAANEAVTVAWIFFGYFVWDVLTKAVIQVPASPPRFVERLTSGPMRKRGWISLACMILAILGWIFLVRIASLAGVLLADAALLSLVFLFRAWKESRWGVAFLPLFLAIGFAVAAVWAG